jgi:hypothetical protein
MKTVLDEAVGAGGDAFVAAAARKTLEQVEWDLPGRDLVG